MLGGLASFPCTLPHEKARSITARPPPWPAPRNPASVSEEGERPLKRRSSKLACLPSDDRGKGVVENDQNVSCSMGPLPLPKHSQYGGITQCRNAVVAPAQLAYRITTLRHETSARESAAGRHHGSRHAVDGFRCVKAWQSTSICPAALPGQKTNTSTINVRQRGAAQPTRRVSTLRASRG